MQNLQTSAQFCQILTKIWLDNFVDLKNTERRAYTCKDRCRYSRKRAKCCRNFAKNWQLPRLVLRTFEPQHPAFQPAWGDPPGLPRRRTRRGRPPRFWRRPPPPRSRPQRQPTRASGQTIQTFCQCLADVEKMLLISGKLHVCKFSNFGGLFLGCTADFCK